MGECQWVSQDVLRWHARLQVMPYSTGLSTPLANFEANQNYKDTVDPSVMVRLRKAPRPPLLPEHSHYTMQAPACMHLQWHRPRLDVECAQQHGRSLVQQSLLEAVCAFLVAGGLLH